LQKASLIFKDKSVQEDLKLNTFGKHLRLNEWVYYTETLTIYERKTNPLVLKLKSEIGDSFLQMMMDEKRDIKGKTVSEVYGKVSRGFIIKAKSTRTQST
jgi:hypothetical protein